MLQRKATSPLLARTTTKIAHRANVVAVTDMVGSAVNAVTVPNRPQTKQLTPTPTPRTSHQCKWPIKRSVQLRQ